MRPPIHPQSEGWNQRPDGRFVTITWPSWQMLTVNIDIYPVFVCSDCSHSLKPLIWRALPEDLVGFGTSLLCFCGGCRAAAHSRQKRWPAQQDSGQLGRNSPFLSCLCKEFVFVCFCMTSVWCKVKRAAKCRGTLKVVYSALFWQESILKSVFSARVVERHFVLVQAHLGIVSHIVPSLMRDLHAYYEGSLWHWCGSQNKKTLVTMSTLFVHPWTIQMHEIWRIIEFWDAFPRWNRRCQMPLFTSRMSWRPERLRRLGHYIGTRTAMCTEKTRLEFLLLRSSHACRRLDLSDATRMYTLNYIIYVFTLVILKKNCCLSTSCCKVPCFQKVFGSTMDSQKGFGALRYDFSSSRHLKSKAPRCQQACGKTTGEDREFVRHLVKMQVGIGMSTVDWDGICWSFSMSIIMCVYIYMCIYIYMYIYIYMSLM